MDASVAHPSDRCKRPRKADRKRQHYKFPDVFAAPADVMFQKERERDDSDHAEPQRDVPNLRDQMRRVTACAQHEIRSQ